MAPLAYWEHAAKCRRANAQARSPPGDYVRRHIPELAGVAGPAVHEPWRLSCTERTQLDYPAPIIAPNLVRSR